MQFLARDNRADPVSRAVPSVELGLRGDGVVDVVRAAHAVLAGVLAPHLRLLNKMLEVNYTFE